MTAILTGALQVTRLISATPTSDFAISQQLT